MPRKQPNPIRKKVRELNQCIREMPLSTIEKAVEPEGKIPKEVLDVLFQIVELKKCQKAFEEAAGKQMNFFEGWDDRAFDVVVSNALQNKLL